MRMVVLAAGLALVATAAHATMVTQAGHTKHASIDFRTWDGANGARTWMQDGVYASAWHGWSRARLAQNASDGLGVKRLYASYDDEIGGKELLYIALDGGRAIDAVLLSDLYRAPDGGKDGEEAYMRVYLDNNTWFSIKGLGNYADQANGEATVHFAHLVDDHLVTGIKFYGSGEWGDNFSVAGLSEVPLPGAVWLLGAGLAGLGLLQGRRKVL